MKIAQVSPPWLPVPPVGYGGTELVVHNVTEELVKRGHEVTLFATGDSKTKAKLEYYYESALGNDAFKKKNPLTWLLHLHQLFAHAEDFDIIHNHAQYIGMILADLVKTPSVHTLHGAFYQGLDAPSGEIDEKRAALLRFKNRPFISISNHQRTGLPDLNYVATVYNGIDIAEFRLGTGSGQYLCWLGRVTPSKGLDEAILIARKAGIPLKIAAFVDPIDRPYFEQDIMPLIDGRHIQFVGEIKSKKAKSQFFEDAMAFLFPLRWHEPFGLVMVESMACGTPVIAYKRGSVPEVVVDGKTGFVVETREEMETKIKQIDKIDRRACREHVTKYFTIEKMVDRYERVYRKIMKT